MLHLGGEKGPYEGRASHIKHLSKNLLQLSDRFHKAGRTSVNGLTMMLFNSRLAQCLDLDKEYSVRTCVYS
jgi:hypothetical protein